MTIARTNLGGSPEISVSDMSIWKYKATLCSYIYIYYIILYIIYIYIFIIYIYIYNIILYIYMSRAMSWVMDVMDIDHL